MPVSVNFDFLQPCDDQLVVFAARAERYVFDDPNTSLLKIRQFAELLARHAAAFLGLDPTEMEFVAVVAMLRRKNLIGRPIRDLFDLLRLRGNEANHEGKGDRASALQALATAHHLARWFHQTFLGGTPNVGPFRPPPDPRDAEQALIDELNSLRGEAAGYQQELSQARGEHQQVLQIMQDLQQDAQVKYRVLAQQQQLVDTERQFEIERNQMAAKIAGLAAIAQQKTPDQLRSYVERSRDAAKRLAAC